MYLVQRRLCPEPEQECGFALQEALERGAPDDWRPCQHCRMPDFERSMATPMGAVLQAAVEWQNDIEMGFPPRPEDITIEEYEALLAIRWARDKRETEMAEEQRAASEAAAARRRHR